MFFNQNPHEVLVDLFPSKAMCGYILSANLDLYLILRYVFQHNISVLEHT